MADDEVKRAEMDCGAAKEKEREGERKRKKQEISDGREQQQR